MDFEFSDRYQPLFDLLSTWDEVDRLEAIKAPTNDDKEDLRYFQELKNVDTVLISGGRDSGKSFALSTFNCIAVSDYNHRVMYTRYTMSSTDNSISTALSDRMIQLGMEHEFELANNNYTLKSGEIGKISISGQKTSVGTQTAKLKSLEDYSIFETDEGEEIKSFEEWKKVKRSMRAKDVQTLSIISFNPPTREHWIADEFYDEVQEGFNGIVGNVMYIHTTYIDNGKENMAEQNWNEYEALRMDYELYLSTDKGTRNDLPNKIIKNFKEYKYSILGGFRDAAEGVIYEDWEIGEFNESLPYVYGLDFGSSDPDAITRVAVDENNKRIYIDEIYFKNNTSTGQLIKIIHDRIGTVDLIIADAAERRLIGDFYNGMYGSDGEWYSGVNIRKVRKSKGVKLNFVARRIKTVQSYTLVITPRSKNVIKAVKNYVWHDSRAGVPKHDWSDLCDSFGYAAIDLIEY